MNKRRLTCLFLALLLAGSALSVNGEEDPLHTTPCIVDGSTLYVGGSGPGNYTRIQDAIDNATDGDTVYVYNGVYLENVVINKSLNVVGQNKTTTIIDGGQNGDVVWVSADWVYINRFTIKNSSSLSSGVKIYTQSNNSVIDNIITNNRIGISLEYSGDNNLILENTITANQYRGIFLYSSRYNIIRENTITANQDNGIHLRFSCNTTVTGNLISSNTKAGISLEVTSCNNTIIDNTVQDNWDGITITSSGSNNTISSNTISGSYSDGIELTASDINVIDGNTIFENLYGIDLSSSCLNSLAGNSINNNVNGLVLGGSHHNTIADNVFVSCGLAVHTAYHNILTDNIVNGKPLVYLEDESDLVIDGVGDAGQAILVNCTNISIFNQELTETTIGVELWNTHHCTISGNIISNNTDGIYIHGSSSSNTITGNLISSNSWDGITQFSSGGQTITDNILTYNNWYGIYLRDSDSNIITGNTIRLNTQQGIYVHSSGDNFIIGNTISDNTDGIYLLSSSSNTLTNNTITSNALCGIWAGYASRSNTITTNTISLQECGILISVSSNLNHLYHNNFIDNNENARDTCTNTWNDEYPSGGNYWDDYNGSDDDGDGIGDTPYNIPGGDNQDGYPLMEPYGGDDTKPPTVEITAPEEGFIYFRNNKIIKRFFFNEPFVIGKITITIAATDNDSGINRVEFYIDDKLKYNDTAEPYNWTWNERAFFRHTIKVIVYDNAGNSANDELLVWKFF